MLSYRPLDAGVPLHAKTPRRVVKGHVENEIQGAMTVGNMKSKGVAVRTPFHPATLQPDKLLKGPNTRLKLQDTPLATSRPLVDKTPFPNRVQTGKMPVTPLPNTLKSGKALLELDSQLRPSATRTHIRVPRISDQHNLKTPPNKGNHWDISDGDIEIDEELPQVAEPLVQQDDLDDVEYVPPKVELPYDPPFDFVLPNYRVVGKTLIGLACSYQEDEVLTPNIIVDPTILSVSGWSESPPEIESDDPFVAARLAGVPRPTGNVSRRLLSTVNAKHITTQTAPKDSLPPKRLITRRPVGNSVTTSALPNLSRAPLVKSGATKKPVSSTQAKLGDVNAAGPIANLKTTQPRRPTTSASNYRPTSVVNGGAFQTRSLTVNSGARGALRHLPKQVANLKAAEASLDGDGLAFLSTRHAIDDSLHDDFRFRI